MGNRKNNTTKVPHQGDTTRAFKQARRSAKILDNFTVATLQRLIERLGLILHNSLTSLQGGTTDEYYHMTEAQHTALGASTYTSVTDPATNIVGSTANVDSFEGIIVTLTTTANSQTLQTPTITTTGSRQYTVINNDTSTDTLTIDTVVIEIGQAIKFVYDASVWIPVIAVDASDITNVPAGSIAATDVQAAIDELDSTITALTASAIANVAAGNIVATDVQAAVNELDTEKLALAGGTMSGAIAMGGNDITNATAIDATTSVKGAILAASPDVLQSITAATDTLNGAATSHLTASPDADYVLTSTPTIPDGNVDGQILYLHNPTSFTLGIQDESLLTGSNILVNGAESTVKSQSIMTLLWDTTVGAWHITSNPNTASVGANADTLSVRNASGGAIAAGKCVYITGFSVGQARPTIDLADADDITKMPCFGITTAAISNNTNGDVISAGTALSLIDTSSASVNDGMWVSNTPGELVFTRPAVDSIQRVGTVARAHASSGVAIIMGAGRMNDNPQIELSNEISTPTAPAANLLQHYAKDDGGTTRLTIQDSASTESFLTTDIGTETLTNKTLTTPIISTISNTGTLTLPTSTDTLIGRATTDTLTNKTLTAPTLTSPIINVTSDAHGDVYFRNTSGAFARLAPGTDGQFLETNGAAADPSWSTISQGVILQSVSATKTDTFSTASTTYTDLTTITVSITPSSTSSDISIIATISAGISGAGLSFFRLVRDSTAIGIGAAASSRIQATQTSYAGGSDPTNHMKSIAMTFTDSPSTTSATTYKVQVAAQSGVTLYVNRSSVDTDDANHGRDVSTITVMEIGP